MGPAVVESDAHARGVCERACRGESAVDAMNAAAVGCTWVINLSLRISQRARGDYRRDQREHAQGLGPEQVRPRPSWVLHEAECWLSSWLPRRAAQCLN